MRDPYVTHWHQTRVRTFCDFAREDHYAASWALMDPTP